MSSTCRYPHPVALICQCGGEIPLAVTSWSHVASTGERWPETCPGCGRGWVLTLTCQPDQRSP